MNETPITDAGLRAALDAELSATLTTAPRPKMHRAWPGPGVLTCHECGGGVHSDASGVHGWAHDDPALDTPPDTTPDGLPTVEERDGTTPIVRCGSCGSTRFASIGETSFTYQRTLVDTEDEHPSGEDYDSGDLEETWAMSVDFAECADCGVTPNETQSEALGRAVGVGQCARDRTARIVSAAVRVAAMGTGVLSPLADRMAELEAAIQAAIDLYPEERRAELWKRDDFGELLHG